jgi:hypothetical protein
VVHRILPLAGLLILAVSCSGRPSSDSTAPTAASDPSSTASATGSRVSRTSADPSPSPGLTSPAATCPFGPGTLETTCSRKIGEQFEADVNAAIDRLALKHPEYFDTTDVKGDGEWRVLRPHEYLDGVVDELRLWKFCAETDRTSIVSVKNSSESSEDYNILLATDHVQRGNRVYQQTCTPASFPVEAKDAIAYVRVHFYSVDCEPGIETPRNGADQLPVGCRGLVTATPKQKNNLDVPPHIVGAEIAWSLEQGKDKVIVHDYPGGNAFNKILVPQNLGHYQLCATVHGVTGCQDADVLPDPR